MAGNPEINRDSLDRVLTSTQFKPDDFLKKYDEWTKSGTKREQFRELKKMLQDYGYNSVWPFGEQELHEAAAVIRKQLEERNKTVAQNREARAQIPNSSTPSENKVDVPTQANTSTAELRSSLENSLTPTSLETSIIKSEEVIRAIPDKKIQASMRAINASILFDVFRQAGHNLLIDGNTIKIEPKPDVDVVQLQEKLQTLLSTGYISLTSLKEGILYAAPSFQSYVDAKKLKNGSIDQKANVTDFTTYLTDLKQSGSTNGDIDYLLANSSQLNGVSMQTAISQYQDLGQVGDWATKNPQEAKELIQAAQNAGAQQSATPAQTSSSPTETTNTNNPSTPPGTAQKLANEGAGKIGEFFGNVGENAGGFAGGLVQALGKGFEKGGAVGGTITAIILVVGLWKGLNKDWNFGKLGTHSGWMLGLLGLGGKAGYDMAKEYGLIPKGDSTPAGENSDASGNNAPATTNNAPEGKPQEASDKIQLSPSQKLATQAVLGDRRSDKYFTDGNKEKATKQDYVDFINTNLLDKPYSLFVGQGETSIFNPNSALHADFPTLPDTMSPLVMKDILRIYILGITTDTINLRLASDYVSSGTKDLLTRKKAAIESLGQSIPISEILKKIYISPNETKDSPEASQESVVKKIDGYTVNLMNGSNQVLLDATNLQKKIAPSSNGGYILYVTALDPTKIHPQADKIEEIQIVFDKNGSLITKTIDLIRSEKSSGSPIAHKQTYTISQSGNALTLKTE